MNGATRVTMPSDFNVELDVQELLASQSNVSAQQIATLLRRIAELEAMVSALRRMLTAQAENTPHPKPRAVSGD
jgi:hypothetical protein